MSDLDFEGYVTFQYVHYNGFNYLSFLFYRVNDEGRERTRRLITQRHFVTSEGKLKETSKIS